ncbi:MAG: UbiA family prenyltransferase [Chitinophagales bacterium]
MLTPGTQKWWDAFRLMRLPFSIFLMPVYWFALINIEVDATRAVIVFVTLHLFVFPASNAYNSYFDRDEQSIGGLKKPPKVTKELWYLILISDFLSILSATMAGFAFAIMVFIYLMVSKAYSYEKIRLKRFPVTGAITVMFFQGWWTYIMIQAGASASLLFFRENLLMAIVSSLFLLGSYPITQIYQHEEDRKNGVHSLSMLLGITGTFIFSSIAFIIASILLIYIFVSAGFIKFAMIYISAMIPVNIYFLKWYSDYKKGYPVITFERTMRLNALSSLLLSAAFISMLLFK